MKVAVSKVKKIAVFRALHLGDLLCAMPAFSVLRASYPQSWISLIGLENSKPIVERFHKYIDELIVFPGYPGLPEQDFDRQTVKNFIQEMRNKQIDLLLQMQGNGTIVNTLCAQFRPRYLAGFHPKNQTTDNPLFIPYPDFGHESNRHLLLLKHLGLSTAKAEMDFPLTQRDTDDLHELMPELTPDRYVCIHPGSRNPARQWPISHFAKVGDYISKQGYKVIITGTESEIEISTKLAARMHIQPYNLAGKTTLGSMALLLKNSAGLISNCTGVSHVSAALKVRSVIISMDGEPARWGPTNKDLHYTHNWLEDSNFESIMIAVRKMLSLARNSQ